MKFRILKRITALTWFSLISLPPATLAQDLPRSFMSATRIVKGECRADSHIAEGNIGDDLTKRQSRFYCDAAVLSFLNNDNKRILIQFAESKSNHVPPLAFAGLMVDGGQTWSVERVYLEPLKPIPATGGGCKFFFDSKILTHIFCAAKIDEGGRRTVAMVVFEASSEPSAAAGAPSVAPPAPRSFQATPGGEVFVLGTNGNLWLEQAPSGTVPPTRVQVDGNVDSFQAMSDGEVFVLGTNGNLWLEHRPFGTVPPPRVQVEANVQGFQALSPTEVYVAGTDRNLWLEHAPFGTLPPPRVRVDANVQDFHALSTTEVYVAGTDRNLWLESAPFGTVPPARVQVDGNVQAFEGLSKTEALVLGANGDLWLEHGPFGAAPPARAQIDANVAGPWLFRRQHSGPSAPLLLPANNKRVRCEPAPA